MDALGLIETKGFLGAVIVADVSVKAANVSLINAERIKGGYVTVQLNGDVGAVKAAVEAATEAIEQYGTLVSSHVIPRMHSETTQLIYKKKEIQKDQQPDGQSLEPKAPDHSDNTEEKETSSVIEHTDTEEQSEQQSKDAEDTSPLTQEDLEAMTVHNLRKMVRERNLMQEEPSRIKYSKKSDLIDCLLNEENEDKDD